MIKQPTEQDALRLELREYYALKRQAADDASREYWQAVILDLRIQLELLKRK